MPRILMVTLLALFARPLAAQTIPITTCGQTLTLGQTGVLQNDLDCSAVMGQCLPTGEPCAINSDCNS